MCETPSWKLEPRPLPPTPHKHLYLWSDHHIKGAWWLKTSYCFRVHTCVEIFSMGPAMQTIWSTQLLSQLKKKHFYHIQTLVYSACLNSLKISQYWPSGALTLLWINFKYYDFLNKECKVVDLDNDDDGGDQKKLTETILMMKSQILTCEKY